MICFDLFPDSVIKDVDIHRTNFHEVMVVSLEDGSRVNFFLTEQEMESLLHKFDAAKERWLKHESSVPKLSD